MSAGAGFAGLQIAGALVGGLMGRSSKNAEARADDENGRLSLLQGEQEITNTRHDERQVAGEDIAAVAESGMVVGTGTAADLIQQSALEREIEIGNIRAQATGKAQQYYTAGATARAEGNAALIGGILQAGAAGLQFAAGQHTQGKLDAQSARQRAFATGTTPGGSTPGSPFLNYPLINRRRLSVLPGPSF